MRPDFAGKIDFPSSFVEANAIHSHRDGGASISLDYPSMAPASFAKVPDDSSLTIYLIPREGTRGCGVRSRDPQAFYLSRPALPPHAQTLILSDIEIDRRSSTFVADTCISHFYLRYQYRLAVRDHLSVAMKVSSFVSSIVR